MALVQILNKKLAVCKMETEKQEVRLYKPEKFPELLEEIIKNGKKGIAVGAINLMTRLPIPESILEERSKITIDEGRYSLSVRLEKDRLYFAIYSPQTQYPFILAYEGPLVKELVKELGLEELLG